MRAHPVGRQVWRVEGSPRTARYEIRVCRVLSETLLAAFAELEARTDGSDTVLFAVLPDQAALHGALAQIEALGLELLEVRCVPL